MTYVRIIYFKDLPVVIFCTFLGGLQQRSSSRQMPAEHSRVLMSQL